MNEKLCVRLNTGQLMPKVGLGTFAAQGDLMQKTLNTALKCGYRSVDTACLYLNEDAIGLELKEWIDKGTLKREEIFITSKLPLYANRKEDVRRFCLKSMKNLQLKSLDLYIIHQPFGLLNRENDSFDPTNPEDTCRIDYETDIVSVYKEMEKLVDDGLVKAIGLSNFNEEQIHRIMKIARVRPSVLQVEAHVYMQQAPLLKVCNQYGMIMCGYGPLGAPYRGTGDDGVPLLIEHPDVLKIAKRYNKTAAQILLKYLLLIDIIVIPKSATPSRIKQNIELFDFTINDQDLKTLKEMDKGEDGRVLTFVDLFKGCENHKEYPFKKSQKS